jgi:DNA invertase Pin-like site-specific DNA recombinase
MFPATLLTQQSIGLGSGAPTLAAIGYIRRSRVDSRRQGAISHEQQAEAIKALALKEGDDPDSIVWIEDWGRSGAIDKQHLRHGFAQLETMVKSGQVETLYSFNMSRLARSLETLARLAHLCEANGVVIKCADGQAPDVGTATGRMVLGILGAVYEWQSSWTKERAIEGVAIKRAEGKWIGPAPFGHRVSDGLLKPNPAEDINVVIETFKRTGGSYEHTARALSAQGVPTRSGKPWRDSSVKVMMLRVAPDLVEATKAGRRGGWPTRPALTGSTT